MLLIPKKTTEDEQLGVAPADEARQDEAAEPPAGAKNKQQHRRVHDSNHCTHCFSAASTMMETYLLRLLHESDCTTLVILRDDPSTARSTSSTTAAESSSSYCSRYQQEDVLLCRSTSASRRSRTTTKKRATPPYYKKNSTDPLSPLSVLVLSPANYYADPSSCLSQNDNRRKPVALPHSSSFTDRLLPLNSWHAAPRPSMMASRGCLPRRNSFDDVPPCRPERIPSDRNLFGPPRRPERTPSIPDLLA